MVETSSKVASTSVSVVENPRLSDVLFGTRGFDSLAAVPSNLEALEASILFGSGLQTFAAIIGPSGWGKTHMLEAVARQLRSRSAYRDLEVHSATEWLQSSQRPDPQIPLLLDDVQDVLSSGRLRVMFRLALERRAKAGRPTLLAFTAPKANRSIKGLLPSAREWVVSTIAAPAPEERQVVVRKIAAAEGVQISDALVKLLSSKLRGNGLTIRGAMKRLKLHEGDWLGAEGTLRACGVLNPFFSDNSSWDLREHIMECAKSTDWGGPAELGAFVMLRKALLAEADVAAFLQVEPGAAYKMACGFEKRLQSCVQSQHYVDRFIERAVAKLDG